MQTRQFGKTDMHITPMGLGTWAIGGQNGSMAWGPQDDQESIDTIKRALELGINWIDTAPAYGKGHSEEIVGKALKEHVGEKPYIFTKCSLVWDNTGEVTSNLKAQSIRREVEASLKRLGIDAIDLYQMHWPNPDSDIEEGWETMAKLKKEGKVRAIGVSNFNMDQLRRAQKNAPVETFQPPYSLIHPEAQQDILPFCEEHNIGVIVYSPMASGLLTGRMTKERIADMPRNDWRKQSKEFQEPRLSRNLELANLLGEIGFLHNVSAGVVAVAWTLHNPAVQGAIVGSRRPVQIEEMLIGAEFRLSESELEQIHTFLEGHPA